MSAAPTIALVVSEVLCSQEPANTDAPEQSSRSLSGLSFQCARPADPIRFGTVFPDRWMAFLRAHHGSVEEVAVFYGVTDRAARKWWNGVGGPRGDKVAMAVMSNPAGAARYLMGAA